MDLDVLVADSVVVAEAKLYVQGGGWNMLSVGELPVRLARIGLGLSLRLGRSEVGAAHELLIRLVDPDGVPFGLAGGADGKGDGLVIKLPGATGVLPDFVSDIVIPQALNIDGLEFTKPGIHHFVFVFDGREVRRVSLSVVLANRGGDEKVGEILTGQYL
jgi:hypothetical protein